MDKKTNSPIPSARFLHEGPDTIDELLDRHIVKNTNKKTNDEDEIALRRRLTSSKREAVSLYRDILRATRFFPWPDSRGVPWRDVLRANARKEFEEARLERDPEIVTRLLIGGRDAVQAALDKLVEKHRKMVEEKGGRGGGGGSIHGVPFNDMVDFAGKARLFSLTWALLDAMLDGGVPITLDTFARIVRWYASAGLMSEASHAFRRMEDYGCPCDLTAFSAMVTLLSKNSSAANVVAFFDQHKGRFPPSSVVYTTVVHACCRENKMTDVMRLFNEMKENGCTVKGYTYTTVVGALSRGGEFAVADEVLDQMLDSCGGQPNVAPFNAMMREYIKLGNHKKAFKLYNKILLLGCKPDVVTYNLLIDSHCRQNNLGGAMEVLNLMIIKKCTPDVFSFNPIFNLMVRFPGAVSVRELFSRMRVLKCKPNTVTYNLLMQNVRDDDKALLKLLKEMDEEGVEFNLNTYNVAIALLCRVGKYDDACQQLCEMLEVKNLKPNEATYKTVLKSLMRTGEREKLKDVVEKLRKRGLRTRPFRKFIQCERMLLPASD